MIQNIRPREARLNPLHRAVLNLRVDDLIKRWDFLSSARQRALIADARDAFASLFRFAFRTALDSGFDPQTARTDLITEVGDFELTLQDLASRVGLKNCVERALHRVQTYEQDQFAGDEHSESQIPEQTRGDSDRRAAVDNFIAKLGDLGHSVTRTNIWTVAGYTDRTEFERFQRGDPRSTGSSTRNFLRVLNMNPEQFISALEKRTKR